MRILADENIERALVDWLARTGHDVVAVGSVAPSSADRSVLDWAVKERRVLLTYDHDFGDIVFRLRAVTAGVILLRFSAPKLTDRLSSLRSQWAEIESCAEGAFLVVHDTRVRVRRMRGGGRISDFLPGEDWI